MSSADEVFAEASARLVDEVTDRLGAWVLDSVVRIHDAWAGHTPAAVRDDAAEAGRRAAEVVGGRLATLLAADVDEQRVNPLAVLRRATAFPTEVLARHGVAEVVRDRDAEARFPGDVYDLTPAAFADIAPELHEIGILWGAAKARAHLARRPR